MSDIAKIRETFLNYFDKNDHKIIHSSPLVPINDPTLMFVNAGMVPFKNYFTGIEKPEYLKAASSQKCVRAGGKHNDLDNVGYTARHLTFFEMLGNFSFGDYFKDDAIEFSWQLLTKEFDIPKNKLLITVFDEDKEAKEIWKKISGLPENKIISISTDDNFWSMGDTGPCGPCSEIFFDHGDKVFGGPPGSKDEEGDRYVEIWNLVFMQYLQKSKNERVSLPKPSIDTGMGLERISAVLQGKYNNFEIDLFTSLIDQIQDLISIKVTDENISKFRIISDHLRSISFLICDGVLPSNEGRGYVLRRIMRRAIRQIYFLNIKKPILYKLSNLLTNLMKDAYPDLVRAKSIISQTIFNEEEKFLSTLSNGIKILDEEIKSLNSGDILDGATAFKLYDTYGFPVDLTEDLLKEKNLSIDKKSFDVAMEKQKINAKKSWKGSGDNKTDDKWFSILEKFNTTEFLGYSIEKADGKLLAIIKDQKEINNLKIGDEAILIFNQTPFYAESGGQIGDRGKIVSDGTEFIVTDTKKKLGKFFAHYGFLKRGKLSTGETYNLDIDINFREKLMSNHSATHLLHESLRRTLGEHVTQKGSLVASEKLRFDFSHHKSLEVKEINEIEEMVNYHIEKNSPVKTEILSYEKAIEKGALALFGEKYDNEVRVLTMGEESFSMELCGGTHVKNLGEIEKFKLTSQSSVASGIRRVEAVTRFAAENSLSLLDKITKNKKAKKEKKKSKVIENKISKNILNGKIKNINEIKLYFDVLEDVDAKNLRNLIDECKSDIKKGIVCLISKYQGKSTIAIGVTKNIIDNYDAVELVKISSEIMGGKGGGGRKDMALAGARNIKKSDDVFERLLSEIKAKA